MMKEILFEDVKVGPTIKTVPIPVPQQDEVLIKIICSCFKPLEFMMISGAFKGPFLMGNEASGIIEKVGPGVKPDVIGKKVIVYSSIIPLWLGCFKGVWAQYLVSKFSEVYIYDQAISHEQACGMYVNPLTAYGLLNQAKLYKAKACIITAGMSSISRMFEKLCLAHSITPVVIVRNDEHIKYLNSEGIKFALNVQSPKFMEELKQAVGAVKPTFLADSVNDENSMKIFMEMPELSYYAMYGLLGRQMTTTIPLMKLFEGRKHFYAYSWSHEDFAKPKLQQFNELDIVSKDLKSGGQIFGVKIVKEFKLDNFMEGMQAQPKFASEGRVILNLW